PFRRVSCGDPTTPTSAAETRPPAACPPRVHWLHRLPPLPEPGGVGSDRDGRHRVLDHRLDPCLHRGDVHPPPAGTDPRGAGRGNPPRLCRARPHDLLRATRERIPVPSVR